MWDLPTVRSAHPAVWSFSGGLAATAPFPFEKIPCYKILELSIVGILTEQKLPRLLGGRESCNLLHTTFPYAPRSLVNSAVLVQPHLLRAEVEVFAEGTQHTIPLIRGL